MTDRLLTERPSDALAVTPVFTGETSTLDGAAAAWAKAHGFTGSAGAVLLLPGEDGTPAGALLGLGARREALPARSMLAGALAGVLPEGDWVLEAGEALDPDLTALAFLNGGYRFERYRAAPGVNAAGRLFVAGADAGRAAEAARATTLVRDLVNTPTSDLGPAGIEAAIRALGAEFGAQVSATIGDDLLGANLPMIHAVGRASAEAPRLVDLTWGEEAAPRVTLVGKGVAFDTGGLDIKPASGMLLMKKDMGGAANVLGLARLVMAHRLPVRLRVLVPAVENAISGNAFRPGDVLHSRKGKTVEIGNTDAEGRLILADALALGDEEAPQILIDMATLTGAARVALGPDLPPFYTDDETFASALADAARAQHDPLWRMPLWAPYKANLASKIADTNNVTTDGMAGSVTAALFLQGFVEKAASWTHLDVYGWRPKAGPTGPVGGEAQGIRALFSVMASRYGG
ncbi:leucyl aminopeptidase family protein [Aureimonas mangrovi]|uniref:leucyl aminopeptidase family protein n=1 Tax=Aureimonas mangrovi TaxID=2758041 RepID=UPI00163DDD92|nr:leucyl aminopeptidase family protein [Aureimonas mangrovi]